MSCAALLSTSAHLRDSIIGVLHITLNVDILPQLSVFRAAVLPGVVILPDGGDTPCLLYTSDAADE